MSRASRVAPYSAKPREPRGKPALVLALSRLAGALGGALCHRARTNCAKSRVLPDFAHRTSVRWSKEFLEAGKKRLLGDTQRETSSSEVHDLRKENARLKELVAETVLENRLLKKSVTGSDLPEDEA